MSGRPDDAMLRRARARAVLLVIVMLGLGVWGALRLHVVTDIRHFIPSGDDLELAEVSAALADSPLTRTSVLVVEGDRPIEVAGRLAQALVEDPEVEWVRSGIDDELQAAVRDIYGPRHMYLRRIDLDEPSLRRAAAELTRVLGGPKGALLRSTVPGDPFLSLPAVIEGLREGDGETLTTRDGQLVLEDGSGAVLFVRTRSSAFDAAPQAGLQARLDALMHELRAELDPSASLAQSGLARFSIAAETSTRADVTRVSVVSTVCIVVVFLVVFGSLRAVLLTFGPVALGVGGGLLATGLWVGEIHGLTLAFGSALLGVGVDYAVHSMFHLAHPGTRSPARVMASVRPGLLLGAATTIVGLGGLAFTSFPGMRQLALFGSVGIAASLVVTLVVVPAFGGGLPLRRVRSALVDASGRVLDRVERGGSARMWVLSAILVLLGAGGVVNLRWSDGLRDLYAADPELMAEDTRVRRLTGAIDLSRMVLATGDDLQQALERDRLVHAAVQAARTRGDVAGFRSIQPWVPPVEWQRENLERLRAPSFRSRFEAAFGAAGFRPGVFAPFFDAIEDPAAPPLEIADLRGTALWPIVEPFVLELPDRVVVVTWVRGEVPSALREELEAIEGVQVFDQQAFLESAYARYRSEIIQMLGVGMIGVLLLIAARYRRWRPTLAAFLPALAGTLGALGIAGWIGGIANLVHAASLLLVCGIGADYGVFMVEARADRHERAVTLASSLLAGLTTALSFGLLAMSTNPALASVGRSVVVGVVFALLTAPLAVTLRGDVPR